MIAVLGVDPGATTGWALVTCEEAGGAVSLERWGKGINRDGDWVYQLVKGTVDRSIWVHDGADLWLAVEKQYIPGYERDKKVQIAKSISALKVAVHRGRWLGAAEAHGLSVQEVHPKSWQAAELGAVKTKRAQIKALALQKASALWPELQGLKKSEDHIAEAALIARYWAKKQQHAAMLAAGGSCG
jgi:Holliday junction resolvasome RuvABC endonuclease subunit